MLEITAARSRSAGYDEAAIDFEDGAAAFRMAVTGPKRSIVDMSDSTIENLTSIAWSLLDESAEHPEIVAQLAGFEWDRIGEELAYRDETGGAFTAFLVECPTPADLPAYAAGVVAGLRMSAEIEVVVEL
jgi:hypothetical protein